MKIPTILLFLVLATTLFAYSEEDDLIFGRAINQAGLQRMLTQRLAKSYLAVLTKTNMQTHLDQIDQDVKTFEKNFTDIKEISILTQKVRNSIQIAEKEWLTYKQLIQKTPNMEDAQKVLSTNSSILEKCNQVVITIEKQAQKIGIGSSYQKSYKELAYLTNISGRQRMLSQRIMLYYLASRLKIENSSISLELDKALNLYSSALEELMGSLENTPEIDFKLISLLDNWKKLELICKNLDQLSDKKITDIITIADFMLSEMNQVTGLYESLIDTHIASLMLGNAVNKAGKQRMLCQQATKAYLAIVLDIASSNHQKELTEAKTLFTKSLNDLKNYAPIPELKDAIDYTENLWADYTILLSDMDNSKENATKLLAQNTALLRACHNVVLMLKIYAKTMSEGNVRFNNELVNLIDLSGQQRMLSQRMVLYCMASNSDFKNSTIEAELHKTILDYSNNLNSLIQNNSNTLEIKTRLNAVVDNWALISERCSKEGKRSRDEMLDISLRLLMDMDRVTTMYEEIIGKILDTEAINKAARQRMLTQRIALDAIAINMNIDVAVRSQQLKKNIILFSKQLDELKIYTNNQASNKLINKITAEWQNYKTHASGQLKDENITYLIEHNTKLLNISNELVSEIIKETTSVPSKIASLLTTSGYQRMLSQRITLYALAYRKGNNKELCKNILHESIDNFKLSLKKLQQTSINTPEIYTLLDKQDLVITRMENYIKDIDNVDLFQIIMTSNLLLSDAESLVKSYEELNKVVK